MRKREAILAATILTGVLAALVHAAFVQFRVNTQVSMRPAGMGSMSYGTARRALPRTPNFGAANRPNQYRLMPSEVRGRNMAQGLLPSERRAIDYGPGPLTSVSSGAYRSSSVGRMAGSGGYFGALSGRPNQPYGGIASRQRQYTKVTDPFGVAAAPGAFGRSSLGVTRAPGGYRGSPLGVGSSVRSAISSTPGAFSRPRMGTFASTP